MKRILFFLLFPLLNASAQDLTGIWRGTFYTSQYEMLFGSANKYEIQIDNSGRAMKGITYSYENTTFYGKASMIGMWTPATKNLIFKEDNLLDYRMTGGGGEENVSMFTCYLEYRKEGDREILEGNYTSQLYKSGKDGGSGRIYLERVTTSDFKKEDFVIKKEKADSIKKAKLLPPSQKPDVVKKKEIPVKKKTTIPAKQPSKPLVTTAKPKPNTIAATKPVTKPKQTTVASKPVVTPKKQTTRAATAPTVQKPVTPDVVKADPPKKVTLPPVELPQVLKERKNDLVRTITTSANEIFISLYDNGEVDGDTITVYQNGKILAAHKGLSTRAISLKITIDDTNPDQEFTMVADNLGSIPPNTALMIVNAGDQRYELRLSSSNQNNAVVRFHYQPALASNKK